MIKLIYKKKNIGFLIDSLFIFCMWIFLLVSESFIVFKTIYDLNLKNIFVPKYLICIYVVVLLLLYTINGLGCLNVWKSIRDHKDQFEYYD